MEYTPEQLAEMARNSDSYYRCLAAGQGYGLETLINDPSWDVRAVVAKQGYGLKRLANDPAWQVRREVAHKGFGLETLIDDENEKVRMEASRAKGYQDAIREMEDVFGTGNISLKKGYVVIGEYERASLVYQPNGVQKYCIAHGYDKENHSWSAGCYRHSITDAALEFDPEVIGGAYVVWKEDDVIRHLEEAGVEVTEENIQNALNAWDCTGMVDRAIEIGNEGLQHAAEYARDRSERNQEEPLKMTKIGIDGWNRPVYRDQNGELWKDIAQGWGDTPSLHSVCENEFEGEPDWPIDKEYEIDGKESPESVSAALRRLDGKLAADEVRADLDEGRMAAEAKKLKPTKPAKPTKSR